MLAEHDLVCSSCGNLRSLCSRDDVEWFPQRLVCNATAARQLVERQFHAKHEGEKPTPEDYHYTDGVSLWVSEMDLSPEDDFL